jgi:sulfur carrier protein ThiS adenylyltransferase
MELKNRYERQRDIVTKQSLSIGVVGAGAVGRQVCMQLAAMGIEPIYLVDFDSVDDINLSSQGFRECDVKETKVSAVVKACREMNKKLKMRGICKPYSKDLFKCEVVFNCVDSIETRKQIYVEECLKGSCKLMLDSRMSAEVARVIRCDMTDTHSKTIYETTFFDASEAYTERCTSKTTIYCANITAGLMIAELTRWMRGFYLADECELNILACSFMVSRPQKKEI